MRAHVGELAALGTAICWAITSLSFQAAGRRVGSLPVNILRLLVATLFLSAYCWFALGAPYPAGAPAHAWIWLSLSGVIGFAVGDLCLFRAFVVVGARVSMVIMSLVPPITALTGFLLLGESLTLLDWLGMVLTVTGVCWVVLERRRGSTPEGSSGVSSMGAGIALALGGALGQAVGLVLSKYGLGAYDPFAGTLIRVYAGTLSFGILFTALGRWGRISAALHQGKAMAQTATGAFFGPFLGVSLSLLAVQYTPSGVASTIMSITPVLLIPPAVLIFKEKVGPGAVVGTLLAVAGVALLFM